MSCKLIGPLAAGLLTSALLVGCERSDYRDTDATVADQTAAGEMIPGTATTDDTYLEATKETFELRLAALEERLDTLEDNAEGALEEHVEALEEQREALADRIDRLEPGLTSEDPQLLETELQRLDEEIAAIEREILPGGGTVGGASPTSPGE
jgi:hypothetical protein